MEDETRGPVKAPYAAQGVEGAITVPSSKSLTQRALIAAAMAGPGSRVERALEAEDPGLLVAALRVAGFDLERAGGAVRVVRRRTVGGGEMGFGNNGTGLRFAVAQLAAWPGSWAVDGGPRLRERPLAPLVAALRSLGADIEPATAPRLPLRIGGKPLLGGRVEVDASASSQFVSALLLLGARLIGGLEVALVGDLPSRPYVALTGDVLAAFGAAVVAGRDGRNFVVGGGLQPSTYVVEGDWSAAAFPLAAAAVAGGRVEVRGLRLDSRQGDAAVAGMLEGCGCRIAASEGGVVLEGPARAPLVADLGDAPDLFPALAVVAARAGGRISGLAGLAAKESDRLAVMADRLGRLGFEVSAGPDWFAAPGGRGGAAPDDPLDPAGDHRVAMALAVAGTVVPGSRIADPGCVAKSWPGFWEAWNGLSGGRR